MRAGHWMSGVLLGGALLLLGLLLQAGRAAAAGEEAEKESKPVVDETQVYFGKACNCRAPAVVDADRVFQAIPEYRRILEQKLTEKDPEYSILMLKAARKFRAAVEAAAGDGAYDLVAGVGAVTWEGHVVPDITDQVLLRVEEQERKAS